MVRDLSVIVLSYNHPEITARTLRSLESFSFSQVYLIHNGSMKKHVESLKRDFPSVHHIIIKNNKGFSGGANEGLRQALQTNPWALFLTNDCELVSLSALPAQAALVAPLITIKKTQKVDSLGGLFHPAKGRLSHCRSEAEFTTSNSLKYVPGTAFLIHKDVFVASKGFDESFFTYWEDVDFSLRVQELGFPLLIEKNLQIRHAIGKTCHKHSLYRHYYFQRNRKRLSFQYTHGWQKVRLRYHLYKDYFFYSKRLLIKKKWADFRLLTKAQWD